MTLSTEAAGWSRARARLRREFELLGELKADVMRNVADVPAETLFRRPVPEGWSMAEVIDHLVRVEVAVVRMMREHLAGGGRVTLVGRVRSLMVLAVMYLPTRVPVPRTASSVRPQLKAECLAELGVAWSTADRELEQFLDSLSDADLRKGLFKHPVGGWATAAGALAFVRAHLYHHTFQLARLNKRTNKKAG
jgi:uncharacterized damage-inducible protein DinB